MKYARGKHPNSRNGFKKGHIHSESTRKKISETSKGRKCSEVTKKKISRIAKEKGFGKWMKGKKLNKKWRANIAKASAGRGHTLETRKKISQAHKGSNSYLWQGGKTKKHRAIRNSFEYKQWRTSVFERDDYTCQMCGEKGLNFHADHIKPFSLYPELRFELSNGRTLCVDCHKSTKTWGYKTSLKSREKVS